jgi:hypothetical protein
MPSAGDVIVFGHYAEKGCVSFLGERGSHAGPSEEELYGFIIAPPHVEFDFDSVSGPRDLYPLFIRYQRRPPSNEGESAPSREDSVTPGTERCMSCSVAARSS